MLVFFVNFSPSAKKSDKPSEHVKKVVRTQTHVKLCENKNKLGL
jgi:hypothetical protein